MKTDKQEIRINLCDTCRKGCKVRREAIVSECSKYKLEPKAEIILEQPKEVERCECISSKKTYNEQKHYYEDICITCGKPIVGEKECSCKRDYSKIDLSCYDFPPTCLYCGKSIPKKYLVEPPKPQVEIEEIIITNHGAVELSSEDKNFLTLSNKINELVRDREKIWKAINQSKP